jgi:hypothetical protein
LLPEIDAPPQNDTSGGEEGEMKKINKEKNGRQNWDGYFGCDTTKGIFSTPTKSNTHGEDIQDTIHKRQTRA